MGFSKQEDWSRLPCPPRGDLPNPGIEPTFLASPALADDSLAPSQLCYPVNHSLDTEVLTEYPSGLNRLLGLGDGAVS